MRGGVSYVTMMVLNPIIILFYQNCSVVPSQQAQAKAPPPAIQQRAPASQEVPPSPTHAAATHDCAGSQGECHEAHTE